MEGIRNVNARWNTLLQAVWRKAFFASRNALCQLCGGMRVASSCALRITNSHSPLNNVLSSQVGGAPKPSRLWIACGAPVDCLGAPNRRARGLPVDCLARGTGAPVARLWIAWLTALARPWRACGAPGSRTEKPQNWDPILGTRSKHE